MMPKPPRPRRPPARALLLLAALAVASCAGPRPPAASAAVSPPPALSKAGYGLSSAVARAAPAAVGIHVLRAPVRSAEGPRTARDAEAETVVGAGFLIDGAGHLVTAAHVIDAAQKIIVRLVDQQIVQAELVGLDAVADIALLRIPLPWPVDPPLARPRSVDAGDFVFAIGDPYGLDRSVSAGIVAATNRHFEDDPELVYLQTDLPLHPGDSGGPLIDAAGAIVGMNARIVVGSVESPGLALAVPIDIVLAVARELAGGPRRPRLGARFEDVLPAEALQARRRYATGARISAIESGGLAERMRLAIDDVVVGFNGAPVGDSGDLVRALYALAPDESLRLTVWRGGEYLELAAAAR